MADKDKKVPDSIKHATGGDETNLGSINQGAQLSNGAIEAGERWNHEFEIWQPEENNVDEDVVFSQPLLNARVADAVRNDPLGGRAVALHQDQIVGPRFSLLSKPNLPVLRKINKAFDEVWAKEFEEEVEALFGGWADSKYNWPDASRQNTFTEMIRMATAILLTTGEFFAAVEWIKGETRPFQTAFQILHGSRISNPNDSTYDQDTTRGGITYGKYGEPKIYHVQQRGHGEKGKQDDVGKWKPIKIRDDNGRLNMIHVINQTYPNQSRGISQLASGLKSMKMLRNLSTYALNAAVLQASIAMTIETDLPVAAVDSMMGAESFEDAYRKVSTGVMSVAAEHMREARGLRFNKVKVPHLLPNMKLNMRPLATPGAVGEDFETSLLRRVAMMVGVSYEEFSGDYTQTNYSSARAGLQQTAKAMMVAKQLGADTVATIKFQLWLEEAYHKGMISTLRGRLLDFSDGMTMDALAKCVWLGAGRGQIDELKETQAAIARIDAGISTHEIEIRRLGYDWRDIFLQREKEEKEAKLRGLTFGEKGEIYKTQPEAAGDKDDKPASNKDKKPTPAEEKKD